MGVKNKDLNNMGLESRTPFLISFFFILIHFSAIRRGSNKRLSGLSRPSSFELFTSFQAELFL